MPLAYIYWLLVILYLILGLYGGRADLTAGRYHPTGMGLLLFLILLVLGLAQFGGPIRG